MPRKFKGMNALELRKQLLITESELNRIQLTAENEALQSGVRTLTHGVSTVDTIASSAAMLATNLAAIPRAHAAGIKTERLQIVLDGAALISSVCLALVPRKT